VSLILRKLNFAADWRAVGRRCVVDPECCSTFIDIRPCDTPGACTWTVPTVLYVTYTNWPIPPFPGVLNQTFALQITPYNQFASPENQLGAFDLQPICALREGTNLSGQTFSYQWGPPLPATGPGPRRAVKINTQPYIGPLGQDFVLETWWSMYLHPLCLGGLCPNGGFCDDFSFAYYLDVYEIRRNLTTGSVERVCGSPPGAIAPAIDCGPIGRTVPYGGECTDIQLPADLVFTSSSGTVTVSA